ncbi:MAG TPA: type IV pilus assembly protein PilM [Abditibacteriaceae bacterium]|jgi:type IV pilus assembly protein PilM
MALFGKKSDAGASSGATKTAASGGAKKGLSFGRKKAPAPEPAAAPAGGVEDFSDFGDFDNAASAAPAVEKPRRAAKPPKAEKKGLKGGSVVGVNIGNDSIKVVEIKGKGTQVAVTAIGIAPTPPESISNGVVMSTTALASAIRALLKTSGISTKRVISSVSGSGALVVRVIEVPEMSDAELQGNMTQDADRYIPFPPSEVIMDFKALRALPAGGDGNMEVLLAAAQREIVDLHINVLLGAKLDPQAVDVEPLAAARALSFDGLSSAPRDPDYSDVSALINIGATNTEISVLRGDLLVFTRSVPRGGHSLTQAISDTLGLAFSDAERLKQDMGDALAPSTVENDRTPTEIPANAADFGNSSFAAPVAASAVATTVATANEDDDWSGFASFDESADDAPTTAPPAASSTAAGSTDPFDDSFFNQGPTGEDPQERHAQKQDDDPTDKSVFDFSFDEGTQDLPSSPVSPADDENSTMPTMPDDLLMQPPMSTAPEDHSAFHPEEMAPRGQMFDFNTVDDPSLPSFPSLPPHLSAIPVDDDFSALPTVIEEQQAEDEALPTLEEAPAAPPTAAGFNFSFDPIEAPTSPSTDDLAALAGIGEVPAVAAAAQPIVSAGDDNSAFDFDFNSIDAAPVETPTAPRAVVPEFDINSIGEPPTAPVVAAAPIMDDAPMDAFGSDFDGFDGIAGDDFGFDANAFGVGLVGGEISDDITPATIYGIIHPLLEELAGETRRSLEYFGSRYPDAGVRRIVLVGGGAKLTNIDAYFTQELGIPTARGNPFAGVSVKAAQAGSGWVDENGPLFAVALGLALRDVA